MQSGDTSLELDLDIEQMWLGGARYEKTWEPLNQFNFWLV